MRIRTLTCAVLLTAAYALTSASSAPASDTRAGLSTAAPLQTYQNVSTGLCLDDSHEAGLRTFSCNGDAYQKWFVHRVDNAYAVLESLVTADCLVDEGGWAGSLKTVPCDHQSHHQQWLAVGVGRNIILSNRATDQCLDDSEQGVRAFPCNNSAHQLWF
ncbi:RICIN domain-containing protein [Streptomyces sp. enrichment culture]|uniref:RICIN domain-containing protein n=1 Tax=Streptomyces sp. enrichment culture TaxID=1795815 RepID=UPI003F54B267